jgi:hypothetical protein
LNPWILDASVLLASEDPDDVNHGDAGHLLACGDPLATLDLAFYEAANVATRSWRDHSAEHRLRERITAVADDGGLVRVDGQLVSCSACDLVSRGLAQLPGHAVSSQGESK